jgi:sigma-B regulation protein RsbU (phosphoserine phosphatase)
MPHGGKPALWAYGRRENDGAFPLVIVPHEQIVAEADRAEQEVIDQMFLQLTITGAGVLIVICVVVAIAYRSSHAITRPIRELTAAARGLAAGDYSRRVDLATGDELEQLGEVFNSTGPMLEERQRMRRSLALAVEIQQHLLPQEEPRIEGFDIAGHSVYCDETGGDYFDFIDLVDLGPGKLGIAVGDVTGHGIGAALLMASARGVLRSNASQHGTDLVRLFDALNVHLVRDTGDARFMTLFYGVLDSQARTLTWVSAGHDPALLVRPEKGITEELGNTGMPLGVTEEAEFERAGPVHLEPGEFVVISTDGVWEAHNPDYEMFGKHRFREVLAACDGRSAHEIYDTVCQSVAAFRGSEPQEDDITLVVIRAV